MFPKWVSKSGDLPHPLEGHFNFRIVLIPLRDPRPRLVFQPSCPQAVKMADVSSSDKCQLTKRQIITTTENAFIIYAIQSCLYFTLSLVRIPILFECRVLPSLGPSVCFCIYILKKELFRDERSKLLFNVFLYSLLPRQTTQVSGQERTLGWNGGSSWHTPGAPHIDTRNFGVFTPIL